MFASPASLAQVPGDNCAYDEEAMLALDEAAFDQDLPNGGWRKIGNIPGCEAAAAELIAAYRARHPNSSSTVAWHEGQMLASAGMNERAIPALEAARKDPARDPAGWNHYVDATIAFLAGDRGALEQARDRLAAMPFDETSGLPPLVDGFIELPTQPGQPPLRMRWPPNIEVVDGLLNCFGKPYNDAYDMACRPD
ncbi:MAG: hypothetical protein GX761_10540 [Gammaproteobacteria bacterium]|nr:hypothetical protein [Gammaproteobacteria bacterium]